MIITLKRLCHFFLLPAMPLLIQSCGDDRGEVNPNLPKACITMPEGEFQAKQSIQFQSCSENATHFKWEFGDGASSTLENPSHTYSSEGTYEITLTVSDSTSEDVTTAEIEIKEPSITRHSGFINADETWATGVHLVTGTSVTIQNAIVTIEPGATILFENDAHISVGFDESKQGAIIAQGTEAQPIIFTSAQENKASGDWTGIYVGGGTTETPSVFSYCTFEYGGASFFEDVSQLVKISEGGQASFDHCTFQYSAGYGLKLDRYSQFASFHNNTIREIDNYAMYIPGNHAGSIGENNLIEDEGILISLNHIDQDVTWEAQTCPYVTESNLWIGSEAGNTFTINAGVRLEFYKTTGLLSKGTGTTATLIVNGTAENPVIFTAHDPENASPNWEGIRLNENFTSDSYFRHAIIEMAEYATDFKSVVQVTGTTLNMENCQISGNKSWGIELSGSATLGVFANNAFGEINSSSMRISGDHIDDIDEGNTFSKDISIPYTTSVTESVTWPAVDVYYVFTYGIYVGSPEGNILTLSPGVKIKGEMEVGSTRIGSTTPTSVPGGLIANGTQENPIIFTSDPVYGTRRPLKFRAQALPESTISYCTFEDSDQGVRVINIYNDDSNMYPRIENCTFNNLDSYGIYVANSAPDIADNNTFTNIGIQNIKYQ